jgi:phospholipid/cholesterol/gamma-HCH transport system substrate-binding protein
MREPQPGITRELQVGVFVFAACLVIAAFSFRITDTPIFRRGTSLTTYLEDATGVFKKSKVKMAGIDIGIIENIELEKGKAKLTLRIDKGVEIPAGSHIIPRPLGILGDKYLEVVIPPGIYDSDSPEKSSKVIDAPGILEELFGVKRVFAQSQQNSSSSQYRAGDVIQSKNSAATLDDITRQMGSIGADLKVVSSELRKVIEGNSQSKTPLAQTLKNTEELTETLKLIAQENRGEFRDLIKSLNKTTRKIEQSLESIQSETLKKDLARLTQAAANLSQSLENMNRITSKIERGEGSLGRLVNEEETVEELNRTLKSISGLMSRANRTLAVVDMKGEYISRSKKTKSVFSIEIYPQEDSGYIASVIVDPFGSIERTVITTVTDSGTPVREEILTQNRDGLRFSLQYYKKISDFALRVGVFENRGGVALAYYPLGRGLEIGAELFDFSRDGENPHLSTYLRAPFWEHFYAHVGGYELLSKSNDTFLGYQKSFYVGIGVRFSDDDLKTLTLFPSLR